MLFDCVEKVIYVKALFQHDGVVSRKGRTQNSGAECVVEGGRDEGYTLVWHTDIAAPHRDTFGP